MVVEQLEQRTFQKFAQSDYLLSWLEAFITDRKSRGYSKGTLVFYNVKMRLFAKYCESCLITQIDQITSNDIRQFLLELENKGHNPGGVHAFFRCVRAFLRWYESEAEPENWKNPIKKVKAPKVPQEILEPVELDAVQALLSTCEPSTFIGLRDKALLMALLDTGCRANELISIDDQDVDTISGAILIRCGKGHKPRSVFIGKATRKALRVYLKHRSDNNPALWVTIERERLTYGGLRQVIRRRSFLAGIKTPSIHSFRRGFAINCLRNGADLVSVSRLLGHTGLEMTKRYLSQVDDDLAEAHQRASPVDNSGL
jgi:integrase/recombinase XerD